MEPREAELTLYSVKFVGHDGFPYWGLWYAQDPVILTKLLDAAGTPLMLAVRVPGDPSDFQDKEPRQLDS